MLFFLEFLLLGLGIGILGALIGAGGGFILTPLLLLMFPDRTPENITSTSLAVVFLNALSAVVAYLRIGRSDWRTGFLYGLSSMPFVVLGVFGTAMVTRGPFDLLLGLVLFFLCVSLFSSANAAGTESLRPGRGLLALAERRIVERSGRTFTYRFRYRLGFVTSVVIGFMASFFGIGGGPFNVPVWIQLLKMPPHIAAATAPCMLVFTTGTATAVHFLRGNLHAAADLILPLAIGMVAGAQAGARISGRIHSVTLTRILAGLLVLVSLQILYRGGLAFLR